MILRRFFVCMDTKISKENVLKLLKRKRDGTLNSRFKQLEINTGYSKGHLKKLYKQLATEDIETLSKHKNTGHTSHNAACNNEISYIVKFKELYPKISVAQFKDVYEEDIVLNKEYEDDVIKYHLQVRSYGFYLDLRKYGSTRHAGFGLGFERCVMYLTGMSNIRDVIPFPRTVNNCEL